MKETQKKRVWLLGQENTLEKKMATHSSILAWRIPWTEEPGGLQSMGLQESDTTEHVHTVLLTITRTPLILCFALLQLHKDCVFVCVVYKSRVCATLHQAALLALSFNVICSLCVSVSHFGNSYNIANLFIMVIIFIRAICDQWHLMLLLQKDYDWLKAQIMVSLFSRTAFLMKTYALFRHSAIAYLTDCTIVYITLSHALGNWKICDSLYCEVCFRAVAALCWSSREEIPHIPGKRKPSKMVGTERGHQRADRLKPQSQTISQSDHMDHSLV